ncbi:putative hydroxyindole O-methyltransferase, partial [Nemania abortiva]
MLPRTTEMANDVEAIVAQLQAIGVAYAAKTPGAREKLMSLSRDLISNLELPSEFLMRMGWAEPALAANCRIAVDLEIFGHLNRSGATGVTSKELAAKCNTDAVLMSRIMRHLVAMNVASEKGEDSYSSTPLTEALAETRYRNGIIFNHDVAGPSFRHLPEYLKDTNYELPTKATDGLFQASHKTELSIFSWLDQTPPYLQAFNSYMSAYRSGKPSWLDPGFYPVAERLIDGFNSDYSDTFLVDVGGGKGHDLHEVKEKYPHVPGKLVLQDRPQVISTVTSIAMPHDFFTPQPVKHARAYHLHSILHNWSDDDCIRILRQLRPAMRPGYSRLLINEIVMPRQNPTWPATSMDQLMLVINAVQERTEADLAKLLKQAGFNLVNVYSYELGQESLVEAEPDEEEHSWEPIGG